jgi:hypothetical protein
LWITVFIIIAFIFLGITFYLNANRSLDIKIENLCEVKSENPLTGGWWFTVSENDDPRLTEYGIILPEVDFNSYNLIISDGREIKDIKFIRDKSFPFKKTHFVDVLFGKQLHPYTWFIYKLNKISIYHDERSGEVRIED